MGDARDLRELPLERGGDRRGHRFCAGALEGRSDLNGGKIHLRQRCDRQERIGDQTDECQRRHQQRRGDRTADEGFGEVHEFPPAPAIGGEVTVTGASRWSLYCPSVTIRSPPLSPEATTVRPSYVGPTSIGRGSARFFAVTVQTNRPCGPRCTAAEGTTTALPRVSSSTRALTNSPGHSFSSSFGKHRLEPDGGRGLVDHVVDQQKLPGGERAAVVLIVRR